ncbi:MAG: PKD domain-containing protein [Brumimicrobium sp.]
MCKTQQLLALFALITIASVTHSQCDSLRYKSQVFDTITPHLDVKYGEAPVWSFPYENTDLYMDIYLPENDYISNRPLMLWVHPGGFLSGDKTAEDMVALCDSFARQGYVTATIGYRLGFNPLSAESAERAVYRGTQDMRAAIRYLKENASTYGIDTNYTFIGGSSAGGFAALHTAYLDQDEAPSSIGGQWSSPDLGCLDCEGNTYSHGINLKGYTNLWGAIGDSLWINSNETVPGLLVHGTDDGTVPYGVGHPFGVFTTPITHGSRSISNQLNNLSIAHEKYIIPGEGHEPHGVDNGTWNNPPTPYWDTIFDKINAHYFSIIKPEIVPIIGQEEVCTNDTLTFKSSINTDFELCWEIDNGNIVNSAGDSVQVVFTSTGQANLSVRAFSEIKAPSDRIEKSIVVYESPTIDLIAEMDGMEVTFSPTATGFVNYLWNFGDGNSSSSFSPSHTYDSPGNYFISLTVVDQNGCSATKDSLMDFSTLSVFSDNINSNVDLYPNPVESEFKISSSHQMDKLIIYSVSGSQLMKTEINDQNAKVNVEDFPSGIYMVTVFFNNQEAERLKIVKD